MRRTKMTLGIGLGLVALAFAAQWWYLRPQRTLEGFVASFSQGRYEQADDMLRAPSAIEVAADGGLVLIDHAGRTTAVPAAKLPFLASGGPAAPSNGRSALLPRRPQEFTMTALGPREAGLLKTPAIQLRLRVQGGGIQIQGVD